MGCNYSKEDCINSLQEAYEILGESPSSNQYKELGLKPTVPTMQEKFGSWNEAKDAAGLESYESDKIGEPPEILDISQEKWENSSRQMRAYWRKKAHWDLEKLKRGCKKCGYDEHPTALEWHHENPDEKKRHVSHLIKDRYSKEAIREEVEKCIVLCANCHAKLNGDSYDSEIFKPVTIAELLSQ